MDGPEGQGGAVKLFLGGDVMTGRGVDQILAHPGDPRLWEPMARGADDYVRLAEAVNGSIPRPVDDRWVWGEALELIEAAGAQIRIVNLEASITARGEADPGKSVHYRMAPGNAGCLSAAGLDAVALANNHVLDFGRSGLIDTLDTLAAAGIQVAGAGRDIDEASQPAVLSQDSRARVLLFAFGMASSGIPPQWAAAKGRAGVWLLDASPPAADRVLSLVRASKSPGDVVVVSIHWGSNWGYDVPAAHVDFARRLIDGGVDVVYGHSSHHPRPIEVYRDRLILYGCGDLIDDYEGIRGYERYRDDLRLLYFVDVDPASGRLVDLRIVPMQARQMRLHRASAADIDFVRRILADISSLRLAIVDHELRIQDRRTRRDPDR